LPKAQAFIEAILQAGGELSIILVWFVWRRRYGGNRFVKLVLAQIADMGLDLSLTFPIVVEIILGASAVCGGG
jgi:hypothetical protein